jgi:hypothetical protein
MRVWNRLHAYGLMTSHGGRARGLLARVNLTAMSEAALARALEPFPAAVRALDALHLATMEFLRENGASIELASYDNRLLAAASALGVRPAVLQRWPISRWSGRSRSYGPRVTLRSLDDLVGAGEDRRWDRQPERFRGLQIDHQLELRRLLDRKLCRFDAALGIPVHVEL